MRVSPGAFRTLALLVAAAGLLLTGCTTVPLPQPAPAPAPYVPVPTPAPPGPIPTGLRIPALDVSSTLIPTGVDGEHRLQTPPLAHPEQASWFVGSPEPGTPGPAVILGHVNGGGRPGVFAQLNQLHPGDEIVVNRDAAPAVFFRVRSVEKFEKNEFPTERVYGDTAGPELRLITCGGVFDRERRTESSPNGSYTQNWVVFAEAVIPPERP